MSPVGKTAVRLDYLDSVRGQAALAVVWIHYFGGFGQGVFAPLYHTPLHALFNGAASIALFFVLSGFVLSHRHLNSAETSLSLASFYVKRFGRICTPFAAVLILSKLCNDYLSRDFLTNPPQSPWLLSMWSRADGLSWWETLEQIALVTPGIQVLLVPQAWTLTIELRLAMLVPFMILIARCGTPWLITFCIVSYWLFGVPVFLANFCFGVLLARHYDAICGKVAALSSTALVVVSCIGLFLYNFRAWPAEYKLGLDGMSDAENFIMACGAGVFLALVLGRPFLQRIFMSRPLRALGKVSFSLYLVHFLVLVQITPPMLAAINDLGITGQLAHGLGFCLYTIASLVLASLCYYLAERPSQVLSRRLGGYVSGFAVIDKRQAT